MISVPVRAYQGFENQVKTYTTLADTNNQPPLFPLFKPIVKHNEQSEKRVKFHLHMFQVQNNVDTQ